MDTELLKTFLEVRNTRHFGRAAENLYITQAAVSARIKLLEQALGVVLFIRARNNIQLSPEGERLVPHAEAMMLALARARQDVALEDAGGRGAFMGVRVGIWNAALQERLDRLIKSEPALALRVESHEPGQLTRRLIDRTLDMALIYEPPSMPELSCISLGELTLRLYNSVPRQSVEEAIGAGYVYFDWGAGFARFHSQHFGERVLSSLRTNMHELASAHLAAHGGACYLPASMRGVLANQGLKPIRGAPEFSRELNLVYHSESSRQSVIDLVGKCFKGVKL